MINKFGILSSVQQEHRFESNAHNEKVEQFVRRRYFELRQQRGYADENIIDRAANQEITIVLAHELLGGAVRSQRSNQRRLFHN